MSRGARHARLLALAGLLAAALPACAWLGRHGGPEPTPILWRAGEAVRAAWSHSDELVVEVDLTRVDTAQIAQLMARYGIFPPGRGLHDVLSADTWNEVIAWAHSHDVDVDRLERFKPWLVSFVVVQMQLADAGLDPEQGVETMDEQLGMIDGLPESAQDLMLEDALARADHFSEDTAQMLEAWEEGDANRLEKIVFGPAAEHPELRAYYEKVFYKRNETMAERLARLGVDAKTRFVVVGAGHLVGEHGLPVLLAQRGYHVTRVGSP
jgi:uncharacterized protein YbaP (TraB family)